jgi:hypothetical protein
MDDEQLAGEPVLGPLEIPRGHAALTVTLEHGEICVDLSRDFDDALRRVAGFFADGTQIHVRIPQARSSPISTHGYRERRGKIAEHLGRVDRHRAVEEHRQLRDAAEPSPSSSSSPPPSEGTLVLALQNSPVAQNEELIRRGGCNGLRAPRR